MSPPLPIPGLSLHLKPPLPTEPRALTRSGPHLALCVDHPGLQSSSWTSLHGPLRLAPGQIPGSGRFPCASLPTSCSPWHLALVWALPSLLAHAPVPPLASCHLSPIPVCRPALDLPGGPSYIRHTRLYIQSVHSDHAPPVGQALGTQTFLWPGALARRGDAEPGGLGMGPWPPVLSLIFILSLLPTPRSTSRLSTGRVCVSICPEGGSACVCPCQLV